MRNFLMKRSLHTCLILFSLGVVTWAVAQVTVPSSKKSGLETRLAQALKLFPDADTSGDGVLSVDEGLSYLALHPEAKQLFLNKTGGRGSSSKPAEFAAGAEGTRLFVCGHSFMIYTAGMLPAIAKSAGIAHLQAGQQMIGGSRVLEHWNLPDDINQAKRSLAEGIPDVLTLSPHALLPDEGIDYFTELGLEKNPDLRVLVQASWMPRDGHTGAFTNRMRDAVTVEDLRAMRETYRTGWLIQLETQVTSLNRSVGREVVRIIPVSDAVLALRERIAEGQVPGLVKQSELFRDDLGHPTEPLALLVCYCHFANIYHRSPVGLEVPDSLKKYPQPAELNQLLQELAWDAVSNYPMSGVGASPGEI
jgi:hypothetical protein